MGDLDVAAREYPKPLLLLFPREIPLIAAVASPSRPHWGLVAPARACETDQQASTYACSAEVYFPFLDKLFEMPTQRISAGRARQSCLHVNAGNLTAIDAFQLDTVRPPGSPPDTSLGVRRWATTSSRSSSTILVVVGDV